MLTNHFYSQTTLATRGKFDIRNVPATIHHLPSRMKPDNQGQFFTRHLKYTIILILIQFEKNAPVATKSYFLLIFKVGSPMNLFILLALLCFVVVWDDNNFRRNNKDL